MTDEALVEKRNAELVAQRARERREERARNRAIYNPPDGTHVQAQRYLGPCAECGARITYGGGAVRRHGKWFDEGCDPEPVTDVCVRCGAPATCALAGFYACDGCYEVGYALLWLSREAAGAVPRGFR
jgi:hypothetical protein